uniref:Aminotransferase class V domain-containing protein n=1 Tax=Tetradesmus obliquus TaxID=3088 RepID=A0A383VH74_TETOB|eukprot:jgi/Sobl393_1/18220/SZX64149.1
MAADAPQTAETSPKVPYGTLEEAKAAFLEQHGSSYGYKGWMEQRWQEEVGDRLGQGQHYLDYTGAAQYTTSMITSIMSELTSCAFGNPHSRNPSSAKSTQEVNLARSLVLQHFNADPEQYYVIFTKGATEGLKMVGEFFPWTAAGSSSSSSSASNFVYTQANHKSVLGIGAYAKRAGAQLHCVSREHMDQWLASPGKSAAALPPMSRSSSSSRRSLSFSSSSRRPSIISANSGTFAGAAADAAAAADVVASVPVSIGAGAGVAAGGMSSSNSSSSNLNSSSGAPTFHLVAFPAKDNYEGQLYPLSWIEQVHAKSDASNTYLVVLDAAAYAATHALDLAAVQPDFVPVSFYKLFGYPTGLGALLVRKEAARQLNKVYFGGGSVDYCTAEDVWHVLSAPPAGLEDGTLGYLNIAALKYGFELLSSLGGMQAVAAHVESLRSWTYQQLAALQHSNGRPLLKLFGRHAEGLANQCAIFQFQVVTPDGDRLPGMLVEAAATAAGLHLRTGCNCNPGRCLANLGITPEEERARAAQGHTGPILVVMRPRTSSIGGRLIFEPPTTTTNTSTTSSSGIKASAASADSPCALRAASGSRSSRGSMAGPSAARQLVPVPLPLGSVRASLGAMSTFEDCFALVRFLALTFTDFEVCEAEVEEGEKIVHVVNDRQRVVEVRATISSAGAAEDLCLLDGSQGTQHAAADATIDEEPGSEECEEGMVLYNMLSYAS